MTTSQQPAALPLTGLELAPPQVMGGVRLVPLIRRDGRQDLRLSRRVYGEDVAVVSIDPKTDYVSFVPHALVAHWSKEGGAVFGTQPDGKLRRKTVDGKVFHDVVTARGLHRMVRREKKRQLRFLPLHVAMEGFLALQFGGPNIAWTEYSQRAISQGLSPRTEQVIPGRQIPFLDDALRLFEIHDGQVGMLVFVADALASAFVVPHPDDYLSLHRTLVTDFYGDLVWHYGQHATENCVAPDSIQADEVHSWQDLRRCLQRQRQDWSALHADMANGLLDRSIDCERIYRFRPFELHRFRTDLDPGQENHLGEFIRADDGTLQYLKSYRLSAAQCRRAYLLKQLSEADWHLGTLADRLGCRKAEVILRLENQGFGYLLHQHVIDEARVCK